jgi:HAD superfamily hydrolase (TIGR01509 family)
MIRAVLFDLDGLLIDSEGLHFACWRDALASVEFTLTEQCYLDHWTRAGLGIADFCAGHGISRDPGLLRQLKARLYERRVLTDLQLMPGARRCLEELLGHKRLALATAGYPEAVNPALEKLGLRPYFQAIVTRHDVQRFKPAPDVFLRAAQRLNVEPAHCLVLEDAEKGVIAAHAAGMKCIAIPTAHTADNDFSLATKVLPSLSEVTLAGVEAIATGPGSWS